MVDFRKRRRFLQLAGAGVAASVAGCSERSVSEAETDGSGSDALLTAVVEPDFETLEAEYESGEISDEEVPQRQMELFEEAIADFESRAEAEADDLRIEESQEEVGLFLVDGTPEALIGALKDGDVTVLAGDDLYDQLLQQQQQQQPQPEGGEEIDEEDLEELEEQLEEAEADSTDDG